MDDDGKRGSVAERIDEADCGGSFPEQILLFGSWARGTQREHSDLDVLVVEREGFGPHRSRRAEMTKLWQALDFIEVPLDILVFSLEEVGVWRNGMNHVIARAFREGRVLYEKP